jgi:hypothetical protein
MRLALLPLAAALAACVPTLPAGAADGAIPADAWLEAYCRGGIAGIFDRVLAGAQGDIHAARHPTDDPVPVVAQEPGLVASWFAAFQAAGPTRVDGPGYAPYPYPDAIVCGVILHAPDGIYTVEAPALEDEMMRYLPPRG